MEKLLKYVSRKWVIGLIGLVVGVLAFVSLRLIFFKSDDVHYHANFALYINGHEDPFKSPTFYEEVNECDANVKDNPKELAHMHDENAHLIHVHARAVTWSQFFANLRYGLTDKMVETDAGIFADGQDGNKLSFMLNGKQVDSVANKVIQSEDVLLVNYGQDDQPTLQKRYDGIPRDAHQANTENDPATCSGGVHLDFKQRLHDAFRLSK